MRRRVPVAAAVVYGVASFPDPLAGEIAGGVDVALLVVPFCAAFALAFLPWGRLADRTDPARVIALSAALLGAAGVLLALAGDPATVVLARALQGAAAAGFPPAAQALVTRAAAGRSGRAVGGMMIGVGCGTLGAPLLALAVAPPAALWALGVAAPLAVAAGFAEALRPGGASAGTRATRLRATRGLRAGWAVSALVLGAYWTLLTRVDDLLGAGGAGLGSGTAHLLTVVAGAAGLGLVGLSARATDVRGPRAPMVAVLGAGAAALLATAAASPLVAAGGLLVLFALYWSYLPVVSVQVVRSAPAGARATAIAGLYGSMWLGAAAGGALAALLPGWRSVLVLAGVAWLAAALVAARAFESEPEGMMAPAR